MRRVVRAHAVAVCMNCVPRMREKRAFVEAAHHCRQRALMVRNTDPRETSETPAFLQAHVALVGHDDVVQHVDAEQLPRGRETPGEGEVV